MISAELRPREFDGKDTVYHVIPPFKLQAHTGNEVSNQSMAGNIYIADFFFTTCPSICPVMSKHLTRVQNAFEKEKDVKILSFTVDPKRDTINALAAYARKFGADTSKWLFVTGDKKDIYSLAREGFFLSTSEGDGGEEDFIHSPKFVLVDKKGMIRGYYDGTDTVEVKRLMRDVVNLIVENEKKKKKR